MIGLSVPLPSPHTSSTLALTHTPRILMTVDAVGGVWRYAMDLAGAMRPHGYEFVFAGFGPAPSPAQKAEAKGLGELAWFDAPLDWTTQHEAELDRIPALLEQLVDQRDIDLVHLNLPSQAAGLSLSVPVLVVSHSCVVTWFAAVRQSGVPADWQWQQRRNQAGFDAADAVIAPSNAHAAMLRKSYGAIPALNVVYNGATLASGSSNKDPVVFAAGRWWDDGKNGAVLDQAAEHATWPITMAGATRGPNGQSREFHHADLLGELPHGEVMEWMGKAAIVASPSLYEPFGLAPLEAAGAGAALVLADNPTYRELWEGAALFAACNDPEAFAAAINTLANDATLRADLAAKAQHRAGRYTLAAQSQAMQDVYDHLLQPNPVVRTA
ncbi:glycosyltransferase family 4 protein [Devosia sp. RR2S18]|uniref:glycosyltransferase family 4 protein n=1 Tax=Devosia rhizosphaerae TaxID=3049774 RepID=UPI0032EDE2D8